MRILMVIPGVASDHASMTFARGQADAVTAGGCEVKTFFLGSRTNPRVVASEIARLRRAIDGAAPDVVHAQFGTATGAATALAGRHPLVVSFRGSDLNPLYKSWRRNAADHWLRNAVGRRLSRYAAQRADGIVCVSEQLRQHLPLAARRRAIVIPSAVNLARFAPMPRNEARVRLDWALEDRVVLFNAGRFPALKRPELAIAAVERARASIPGLRMELLDGHLAPTEVPLYVNAANVVLLTSDFEGSPNIVKEAIACGVPVVSTRAGDVPERLADVRPSWVTSSTVNAIADALCAAVAFDGRTNGSEIAARDLDSLSLAQRLIAFYERVLRGIPDSIHEPSSDSPASVNSPAIVSRDA